MSLADKLYRSSAQPACRRVISRQQHRNAFIPRKCETQSARLTYPFDGTQRQDTARPAPGRPPDICLVRRYGVRASPVLLVSRKTPRGKTGVPNKRHMFTTVKRDVSGHDSSRGSVQLGQESTPTDQCWVYMHLQHDNYGRRVVMLASR